MDVVEKPAGFQYPGMPGELQIQQALRKLVHQLSAAAAHLAVDEDKSQRNSLEAVLLFLIEAAQEAHAAREPLSLLLTDMMGKSQGLRSGRRRAVLAHAVAVVEVVTKNGVKQDDALTVVMSILNKHKISIGTHDLSDQDVHRKDRKALENLLKNTRAGNEHYLFIKHVMERTSMYQHIINITSSTSPDILKTIAKRFQQSLSRMPYREPQR